MLTLQDEFSRLKEAHQAQACINSLLSPHQLPTHKQPEEFSVTPEDLRALLRVTQSEVEGRAGAVEAAIGELRVGGGFAAVAAAHCQLSHRLFSAGGSQSQATAVNLSVQLSALVQKLS